MGRRIRTPFLDAFASRGVGFSNAFSTSPLCSPSRASLFTGKFPHETGVLGLVDSRCGWDLDPDCRHLAAYLKDAGYRTGLCGFQHETLDARRIPFDDIISGSGQGSNGGRALAAHAAEIDNWLGSQTGEHPFYLQIGCHETHREFDRFGALPEPGEPSEIPEGLKDIPSIRDDFHAFLGAVRLLDNGFGAIMEVLEKHRLTEETLVVATTDHGIDYPRIKGTFRDPGIETFLLLRYPQGNWRTGTVQPDPVSLIDIVPTILDFAGIPTATPLPGRSLRPALEGSGSLPEHMIYAEKTYHDIYDPTRMIRSSRFKYICYFEKTVIDDVRIATVERSHWVEQSLLRQADEELYDLENDPNEKSNLVDNPDFREQRNAMRAQLYNWMEETNDPLLRGPVASPLYFRSLAQLRDAAGKE
jgi:arylsulfatase A-like enzyme